MSTHYPTLKLTRDNTLARARSLVGQRGFYKLGKGGRNPAKNGPWDDVVTTHPATIPGCDCSGGIAWLLGYDRWQAPDDWFGTDRIVEDARARVHKLFRLVKRDEVVLPGDVLVYASNPKLGLKKGHVELITAVLPGFKRGSYVKGKEWYRFIESVGVSTGRGDHAAQVRKTARLWADQAHGGRDGYIVRYTGFVD